MTLCQRSRAEASHPRPGLTEQKPCPTSGGRTRCSSSVVLDVHACPVATATIASLTGEVFEARLTRSCDHIRFWIAEVSGPRTAVYEAAPTGVARPCTTPCRPGDGTSFSDRGDGRGKRVHFRCTADVCSDRCVLIDRVRSGGGDRRPDAVTGNTKGPFVGVVVSVYSVGSSRARGSSIKAGDTHARVVCT